MRFSAAVDSLFNHSNRITEMKHTASQTDRIASLLERGRSITAMQALEKFDCFRLSARIQNLRDNGMRIVTHKCRTSTGKVIAKYKLAKP